MGADTKNNAAKTAEQTTTGLINGIVDKVREVFDAMIPPEKRNQWWAKLKGFATNHPKLAAFLLTNIVLSGGPLLLFVVFSITVFVVSLIGSLIIAVIAALLFTVFMLLVALFVVLPTIFLTTMAASFIFIWGLGGYYILKWFNEGKSPAQLGMAVGDGLNSLSGGRLTSVMSTLRDPAAGGTEQVQGKLDGLQGKDEMPKSSNGDANANANGLSNTPITKSAKKSSPPKLNAPGVSSITS